MVRRREDHRVTKKGRRTQKQTVSVQNSDTETWTSMLDDRYTVAVHRLGRYRGELTIRDGTALFYRQEVTLMYSTLFGPDVADVFAWQEIAATAVDDSKYCLRHRPRWRWTGVRSPEECGLVERVGVVND